MPLTRPLVVAMLATPLSAFAQTAAKSAQPIPADSVAPQTNTQPQNWILEDIPDSPAASAIVAPAAIIPVPPIPHLLSDNTCYAIRSYVVARDDKDSDSTHLVHYSTCQPASRYRLRTTQIEVQPTER
jgi:hypothetical protein